MYLQGGISHDYFSAIDNNSRPLCFIHLIPVQERLYSTSHTSITVGNGVELNGEYELMLGDTVLQTIIDDQEGAGTHFDGTSLLYSYQGLDAATSSGSSYPSPSSVMKKRLVEYSGGYIGTCCLLYLIAHAYILSLSVATLLLFSPSVSLCLLFHPIHTR
jgi:hypothetical protein